MPVRSPCLPHPPSLSFASCSAAPGLSRRRLLLGVAAAGLAGPAFSAAGVAEPRVLDFDWTDAPRQRPVPARLYLPAQQRGALVVFSHGIGGSRLGYSYIGRHLARHGVASLHLQHVGSDRSLWGGNVLQMAARLRRAISAEEAMARARDLSFGLDWLAAQDLPFEVSTIVAAGHSYGANTSLLVAGAQVDGPARLPTLRDPRVRAAALLSAPPFYGVPDLAGTLGPVALPSLHITTREDEIRIPGYESPASDRVAVFEAIGSRPKALAVFAHGSHSIFTDRITASDGPELNAAVKQATQDLLLAFVQGLELPQIGAGLEGAAQRHRQSLARFEVMV